MSTWPRPPGRGRRFGDACLMLLRNPAKIVPAIVWLIFFGHRIRLPDLRRLTRSARFLGLQAGATAAVSARFREIQDGAAWLARYGEETYDYCLTVTSPRGFGDKASFGVTCSRAVTVVYGFDGSRAARLRELTGVLRGAGWTDFGSDQGALRGRRSVPVPGTTSPSLAGQTPPVVAAWAPPPPPEPQGTGGGSLAGSDAQYGLRLEVGWAGPGGEPDAAVTALTAVGNGTDQATDFYRPIEVHGTDLRALAAEVLAGADYVMAIRITADYYVNHDVARSPLPRR